MKPRARSHTAVRNTVLSAFSWIALMLTIVVSAAGADRAPRKKLLEYGWDVPDPFYIQKNIGEMEKRPFDGLLFRMKDFNLAFDTRRWTAEQLKPQTDALTATHWKKFTDNFLMLYSANNARMDWFDDAQWAVIEQNLRLAARAAKAGRCVGICFDPEPYGPNPWSYAENSKNRPYSEVVAQVRKRGAQFVRALQSELPRMKLLTFYNFSMFRGFVNETDPARLEQLFTRSDWPGGWGLYAPFLNGWLDALNSRSRMIDGDENSYYFMTPEAYVQDARLMHVGVLPLVAPENRKTYRARAQAGFALYMDQVLALRDPKDAVLAYRMKPEDRLRWLEHNTYMALTTTDEYVWCYSEKMNWWEGKFPTGADEAIRSAREKAAKHLPLGFELKPIIDRAKQ